MMIINNHELVYLKVQADICEYMKNTLQAKADSGKIDLGDAADEYEELTKKEKTLHESFVRQAHVRHDGSSRFIKHHLPTDKNPRDYWVTIMEDGKRMASFNTSVQRILHHVPGNWEIPANYTAWKTGRIHIHGIQPDCFWKQEKKTKD